MPAMGGRTSAMQRSSSGGSLPRIDISSAMRLGGARQIPRLASSHLIVSMVWGDGIY